MLHAKIALLLAAVLVLSQASATGKHSIPAITTAELVPPNHEVPAPEASKNSQESYLPFKQRAPTEVARLTGRKDLQVGRRTPRHLLHRVVFARKQRNIDVLKAQLMDVSDPKSRSYGMHLSRKVVAEISQDEVSTSAIEQFLLKSKARIVKTTRYSDYIIAEAPVGTWEDVFQTSFFDISHKNKESQNFIRCLNYTIPAELLPHVSTVFNTVQLPDHHYNKRLHFERATTRPATLAFGETTPDLLNQFYNIENNTGNALTDQAVYAILDQSFSPADLVDFQDYYNIPRQTITSDVGDHVSDSACASDPNNCIEANLDVQYITAVARSVPTIYYYWTGEDVWLDWIIQVADMEDPPDLFTISYGSYELAFTPGYLEAFDTEAIKLGLVGTTLLAASGDDGVVGFLARDGTVECGYYASYPASSPYVTAVGGTMVRHLASL
jgi:tripeptidyl-peptidase-1